MSNKVVVLTILDGYGLSKTIDGNAVANAKKPNLDRIFATYPSTTLLASGEEVGLPEGQMGNSEVGHLNIGAGRIVYQSLTRLDIAVKNQTLDKMPVIEKAFKHAINNNSTFHMMGLLSDGGVHSHINHFIYLMQQAIKYGVKKVVVHAFLDGRDVPPKSAEVYFEKLQSALVSGIEIGVVSGRFYAMDRDKNYDRTQKAYDALVYGNAPVYGLVEGLQKSYEKGVIDEFVEPYIVNKEAIIRDGDSVVFMNFRPDRAIQMSLALTNPGETKIANPVSFKNLNFVQMMLYSDKIRGDVNFENQTLNQLFGEVVANAGLKQLRIAETEKYAHVTYFFDGGIDQELSGATRVLIPSPKVLTYDLEPQMSAYLVTDKVVEAISSEQYSVIILNYANCDMVGHTAVYEAAIKSVEVVDECVGRVEAAIDAVGGTLLLTADHGNAEKIFDENHLPFSAHTTNPVPFVINKTGVKLRDGGNLGDIAPTMLELLQIKQPVEMTGKSLIKK